MEIEWTGDPDDEDYHTAAWGGYCLWVEMIAIDEWWWGVKYKNDYVPTTDLSYAQSWDEARYLAECVAKAHAYDEEQAELRSGVDRLSLSNEKLQKIADAITPDFSWYDRTETTSSGETLEMTDENEKEHSNE